MKFPKRFTPRVTDAACARWLQHVQQVDLDAVRQEILAEGREDWIAQGPLMLHVPRLRVSLVAQDGVVITVLTDDGKDARHVPYSFSAPR